MFICTTRPHIIKKDLISDKWSYLISIRYILWAFYAFLWTGEWVNEDGIT